MIIYHWWGRGVQDGKKRNEPGSSAKNWIEKKEVKKREVGGNRMTESE